MTGISIPVIIHLWNQRPGKTLKVGSISLVTESNQRYQNRLRLAEILLLVLRCLLIGFIALALSGLQWRRAISTTGKGWVLIDPKEVSSTYQHFKPTVDSLLLAGYEFHFFEPGFAKANLQDAVSDTAVRQTQDRSYRNLINTLDLQVDASLPVYLFTNQYLRNFSGPRAAVALNLHWQFFVADSMVIPSVIDTTSLQVTIFSQHYATDARYLYAALEAIKQAGNKNLRILMISSPQQLPARQDWLFWLEQTAPPADHYATNCLSYASGEPEHLSSVILPVDGSLFAAVEINKLIITKDSTGHAKDNCWRDGFGHPVLTTQKNGAQTFYTLYTHIDPAWNELPWSDHFPLIIYALLNAGNPKKTFADSISKTLIDPQQAWPPALPSKENHFKPAKYLTVELPPVCWLIAFLLFFAERGFSFYYAKATANG